MQNKIQGAFGAAVALGAVTWAAWSLSKSEQPVVVTPGDLALNTNQYVGRMLRIPAKVVRVSEQPYSVHYDGMERTLCDMKLVSISPLEGSVFNFTKVTHLGPPNSIDPSAATGDSIEFNYAYPNKPVEVVGTLQQLPSGHYTLIGMRVLDSEG